MFPIRHLGESTKLICCSTLVDEDGLSVLVDETTVVALAPSTLHCAQISIFDSNPLECQLLPSGHTGKGFDSLFDIDWLPTGKTLITNIEQLRYC